MWFLGENCKRIQLNSTSCSCSPIARTRKFQNQMIEVAMRWQEEHLHRRGSKNYLHNGVKILLKHNHKGFSKKKGQVQTSSSYDTQQVGFQKMQCIFAVIGMK